VIGSHGGPDWHATLVVVVVVVVAVVVEDRVRERRESLAATGEIDPRRGLHD